MPGEQQEVVYLIGPDDLLVWFNEEWDRFAAENTGTMVGSSTVRQRSLWEFVSDAETRHLHGVLLRKVRAGRAIRNLPFRCDSPALRRFMEMDITLQGNDKVEYRCRTIRTEARPPVRFNSAATETAPGLLRMCSWCKKVAVEGGLWVEVEDAIAHFDLFSAEKLPPISHGICDSCLQALENET